MKINVGILLIFVLGLSVGSNAADFPQKNAFAYGYQLNADGKMPLYKVVLPEEVYSVTTRKDMGDIRVFNNKGETVPHILKRQPPVKAEPVSLTPLPYFPLYGSVHSSDKKTLKLETDSNGTIITINDDRFEQSPTIKGYIIDTSQLHFSPESLQLEWENKGDSFVTSVSVYYSDDLNRWYPLNQSTTLARLKYNDHELVASEIPLSLKKAKYLKLNWPVERGRGPLTSVKATPPHDKSKQQIYWRELDASGKHKDPIAYEFDTGATIPVEEVNIHFPYKNILVQAIVSSRSDEESQWVIRFQGLVYNMGVEGLVLSNNSFKITPTKDQYWLLEMTSIEGQLQDPPRLRLGWVPQEIIFVAQGQGPYLLAYGSAQVEPPAKTTQSFFSSIQDNNNDSYVTLDGQQKVVYGPNGIGKSSNQSVKNGKKKVRIVEASILGKIQLGGEELLKPKKLYPWKQWILWATMIAGVAVLGRMVWILNLEMKESEKN